MASRIILSAYVFPSLDGRKPADIESAWDFAVKKAKCPILRFHDLRHTAASHLAMSGASPLEIAAILGHKTLTMVKRYSHFSNSATAQILKRMNDVHFWELLICMLSEFIQNMIRKFFKIFLVVFIP